jgi:hypothetical protein
MSRPLRIQYPDALYHVMNRGRPSTKTAGRRGEEISATKLLAPDVDSVVDEVYKFYNVNSNDLLLSRRGYFNEPKNFAIYLISRHRGNTLKDVRKFFEITGLSGSTFTVRG